MSPGYYSGLALGASLSVSIVLAYYFDTTDPRPTDQEDTQTSFSVIRVPGPIQPLPDIKHIDLRWVRLGKALFNSNLLSSDNSISCASCHMVDFGGDDGFPVSTGVNNAIGVRNSPTVLNSVFNFRQFWDGRTLSLEEQVHEPLHNPNEMNTDWETVISKLEADDTFKAMFQSVTDEGISIDSITKALVIYEESLITPKSPIDLYLMGDKDALSQQQVRGLNKFKGFGCVSCHQGVNIGGNLFQKLGRINETQTSVNRNDLGRYTVTGREEDRFVFKVPSLRNVTLTAPYFHDGSVETLSEAIRIMAKAQLGRELAQQDVEDLEALFQAFSAPPKEF